MRDLQLQTSVRLKEHVSALRDVLQDTPLHLLLRCCTHTPHQPSGRSCGICVTLLTTCTREMTRSAAPRVDAFTERRRHPLLRLLTEPRAQTPVCVCARARMSQSVFEAISHLCIPMSSHVTDVRQNHFLEDMCALGCIQFKEPSPST